MIQEIKLPEVGENVDSGEIAKILVAVGDLVEVDQPIVEFETDKAVVEVPSPLKGSVTEINIKVGDTVSVGQVLIKVDTGVTETETIFLKEKPALQKDKLPESPAVLEKPIEEETSETVALAAGGKAGSLTAGGIPREVAPASPAVRRLARELGIDIDQVPGTGPGGRISREDVKRFTREVVRSATVGEKVAAGMIQEPLPDFSRWGEVEIQPMSKVRKITAEHLSYAWSTIPHVTQFEKADITELEQLRRKFGERVNQAGGNLTLTAILLKIAATGLKLFPQFNTSIDMYRKEIIAKKYIHIGIAVDTGRGLLVPVIRDADKKSLTQLSVELTEIAQKAREGKLTPDEMQGGNFSISNLGGIGGTYFTPVVHTPEVAILGVSRANTEPKYLDGEFQPRLLLPLSLSYDHRLIDGAEAVRFLRWIVDALEHPFVLLLES